MAIYTIGYEKLSHETLSRVLVATGSTIYDVRSRPYGRVRKGWDRKTLTELYGERYAGDTRLGGMVRTPKEQHARKLARIALSAELRASKQSVILMCQEHSPVDCHRHWDLALPMAAFDDHKVSHLLYTIENEADAIEVFDAETLAECNDRGDDCPVTWIDLPKVARQ